MFRLLAILPVLTLLASEFASGQIDVKLRLPRRQFVAGEPINATINITNHAGRDLLFQGDGRISWLDFIIKNQAGEPITLSAKNTFGAVKIPVGQTMSRQVDLSRNFRLQRVGNYSVFAIVRLPGQRSDGFLSNRLLFGITKAHPLWSQKVGLRSNPNRIHEFRLMSHSGEKKTSLYAQVIDDRTGNPLQTYSLGGVLLFRKPQATVDANQVMHTLFLNTPSIWVHARIDINGNFLGRELHKRGAAGEPRLITLGTGEVKVAGSVPYDPELEEALRGELHKASERPPFIYD